MSRYRSNGVDFDAIFEPRQGGDPVIADVHYQDGGVDLSDIYAPASVGTPAGNVGYRLNGSDIGPLFCALGERVSVDVEAMSGFSFVPYSDAGPETAEAIVGWNNASAGGSGFAYGAGVSGGGTSPYQWLQGGSASDYEIYFTHTSGDVPTGTLNTWLSLGSVQGLELSVTASSGVSDSKSSGGAYQIRKTSNLAVVGADTWGLSVAVSYEV